jgi:predicted Zn-dependent protease with MMP-like domain
MGAGYPWAVRRDCRQGPDKHRARGGPPQITAAALAGRPTRDNGPVVEMSRDRFEELVSDALDGVPPELAVLVDNVVVLVEEEPPPEDPDLLGCYDGTPLTERDSTYAGAVPDRIVIYRNPILRICEDADEVVEEVRITVVHEIAHHFGIDDDRLHDLGYA